MFPGHSGTSRDPQSLSREGVTELPVFIQGLDFQLGLGVGVPDVATLVLAARGTERGRGGWSSPGQGRDPPGPSRLGWAGL